MIVLADAHRRTMAMHDLALRAPIDSDFQTDATLCGELEMERAMVRHARDELHGDILGHFC
jgi:hypothetical protein